MSLQQQRPAEHPPPYSDETSLLDLPPVPSISPRHNNALPPLPALEPTPSLASPRNPLDAHTFAKPFDSPRTSSTTLQPLRLPTVPTHMPGETPLAQDASDDQMAAEVLCKLGKIEPNPPAAAAPRVPSGYETPLKYYPIDISHTRSSATPSEEQEPLLSLLTSSHPWLGGTINSSVSAYSSTKSYTPRFIQYGADIVENTVGSVGRRSGVEGSIRRYLGGSGRRPSELERLPADMHPAASGTDAEMVDVEKTAGTESTPLRITSRGSVDSLPAYDSENRSPAYEPASPTQHGTSRPPSSRSWSTQLMISTSGLGVALSESSLRSLKYCLQILGLANRHVRSLMEALKRLLQDYEHSSSSPDAANKDPNAMQVDGKGANSSVSHEATVIAARIKRLNDEIWKTFKDVCEKISRYTGGALPENASVIVRWQLMSVPQRWQRAVSRAQPSPPRSGSAEAGTGGEGSLATAAAQNDAAVTNANRMLAFAIEGLDMMEQVGGVVDSTIGSAERWLDSLGRRKKMEGDPSANENPASAGAAAGYADEKMDDIITEHPRR